MVKTIFWCILVVLFILMSADIFAAPLDSSEKNQENLIAENIQETNTTTYRHLTMYEWYIGFSIGGGFYFNEIYKDNNSDMLQGGAIQIELFNFGFCIYPNLYLGFRSMFNNTFGVVTGEPSLLVNVINLFLMNFNITLTYYFFKGFYLQFSSGYQLYGTYINGYSTSGGHMSPAIGYAFQINNTFYLLLNLETNICIGPTEKNAFFVDYFTFISLGFYFFS